jgi:hypothetical protein
VKISLTTASTSSKMQFEQIKTANCYKSHGM